MQEIWGIKKTTQLLTEGTTTDAFNEQERIPPSTFSHTSPPSKETGVQSGRYGEGQGVKKGRAGSPVLPH